MKGLESLIDFPDKKAATKIAFKIGWKYIPIVYEIYKDSPDKALTVRVINEAAKKNKVFAQSIINFLRKLLEEGVDREVLRYASEFYMAGIKGLSEITNDGQELQTAMLRSLNFLEENVLQSALNYKNRKNIYRINIDNSNFEPNSEIYGMCNERIPKDALYYFENLSGIDSFIGIAGDGDHILGLLSLLSQNNKIKDVYIVDKSLSQLMLTKLKIENYIQGTLDEKDYEILEKYLRHELDTGLFREYFYLANNWLLHRYYDLDLKEMNIEFIQSDVSTFLANPFHSTKSFIYLSNVPYHFEDTSASNKMIHLIETSNSFKEGTIIYSQVCLSVPLILEKEKEGIQFADIKEGNKEYCYARRSEECLEKAVKQPEIKCAIPKPYFAYRSKMKGVFENYLDFY